jgi:hypothetical protein
MLDFKLCTVLFCSCSVFSLTNELGFDFNDSAEQLDSIAFPFNMFDKGRTFKQCTYFDEIRSTGAECYEGFFGLFFQD